MAKRKPKPDTSKLYRVISNLRDPEEGEDPKDKRFDNPAVQHSDLLDYLNHSGLYTFADAQGNGIKAHVYVRPFGPKDAGSISVRASEEALLDGRERVTLRISGSTETSRRAIAKDIRDKGYTLTFVR